jgi:trans-aconitate methyltransferase
MTGDKPFSASCERNRAPILEVLRDHLVGSESVLEIGSGTGQHAVHFAAALPGLSWQTSDRAENLPGIRLWLNEAGLPNTPPPLELDVRHGPWPRQPHDLVYSSNTLHILEWSEVGGLFAALPGQLQTQGLLIVYGPFNYQGRFTSASNQAFDAGLRASDAKRGLRDFEAVDALARQAGLQLIEDRACPAHNRCLVWRRSEGKL